MEDYATEETRAAGKRLVEAELAKMDEGKIKAKLIQSLRKIRDEDERDFYF